MALWVVNGAKMTCPFGSAPASLVVLPARMVNVANQPAATIMDHAPMLNIPTFGLCKTPTNPQVAAATAAAAGVLTQVPCLPNTTTPWAPGAVTAMDTQQVVLNNTSKCACLWGGVISITDPGQTATQVP